MLQRLVNDLGFLLLNVFQQNGGVSLRFTADPVKSGMFLSKALDVLTAKESIALAPCVNISPQTKNTRCYVQLWHWL